MKEKAALKNPDEFYFNMVRTKQAPPPPSRPPRRHPARRAAIPPAAPARPHAVPTTTSRMPANRMPALLTEAAAVCRAQVNGVHQKQAKALVTEGEMGRL